jgi:acetyl-CoA C-acetyltransferase
MANRVAIVGIGQTFHKSKRPDVNQAEMANEAVRAALADAQLKPKDVEAVVSSNMETFEGIYLPDHWMASEIAACGKSGFKVATGGTSGASAVIEGFHLVASGLFNICLVVGFEKHDTSDTQACMTACMTPVFGSGTTTGAITLFADQAQIYINKAGAKEEHAAMVRLKADRGACKNPHAQLRLGLKSIEEILSSAYLEWPIRMLDFCPQSNGACALILANQSGW